MIKNKHKEIESSLKTVKSFLKENKNFVFEVDESTKLTRVSQSKDGKGISFDFSQIREVLEREDDNRDSFLQLNFKNGKKLLLTEEFIGFAPAVCGGLDMNKLPKVVTFSDLLSVIEAIESCLYNQESYKENLFEVKLFFESIACGAEAVGFDVTGERLWVEKLISHYSSLVKQYIA